MLAFTLEGSSHLLRLGGDNSFHFYPIAPGYPAVAL